MKEETNEKQQLSPTTQEIKNLAESKKLSEPIKVKSSPNKVLLELDSDFYEKKQEKYPKLFRKNHEKDGIEVDAEPENTYCDFDKIYDEYDIEKKESFQDELEKYLNDDFENITSRIKSDFDGWPKTMFESKEALMHYIFTKDPESASILMDFKEKKQIEDDAAIKKIVGKNHHYVLFTTTPDIHNMQPILKIHQFYDHNEKGLKKAKKHQKLIAKHLRENQSWYSSVLLASTEKDFPVPTTYSVNDKNVLVLDKKQQLRSYEEYYKNIDEFNNFVSK